MGLYIHIPFCKQACHYCNFHFSTSLKQKEPLLEALNRELDLQHTYLENKELASVYLGGGTPSLLEPSELDRLFEHILKYYSLTPDAEVTLEANPDDLSVEKIEYLKKHSPVNRLSIGVQSFSNEDLKWMNRAHNAVEARSCIEYAIQVGFDALTIDLIYGAPTTSDAQWQENVETLIQFDIPHISCYCMTVEDGTALGHFVKKGKEKPIDEQKAARQFEWLVHRLEAAGYAHYEISNFAKPGKYARHNTSYWTGSHYLGIGPSAHSFNGVSRQWNVANNAKYIRSIQEGIVPFELEQLSTTQQYNEYVMTSLRTMWGCTIEKLQTFPPEYLAHFKIQAQMHLETGLMQLSENTYRLTRAGKLLADGIASDLFYETE
ncbi:MAG: radical SAM family heme chaperone HemW [Saprospiraceae bacterium]